MKRLSIAFVVVLIAVLETVSLVACSGSTSSTGSSSANSIYLIKTKTMYSKADGATSIVYENEYDEHGNLTKATTTSPKNGGMSSQFTTCEYGGFDENGYYSFTELTNGNKTTYEWTIENGHATKLKTSSGTTSEFEYYNDGKLKSSETLKDSEHIVTEWDENGCLVKQSIEGGKTPSVSEYKWTLDEKGNVKGYTLTSTREGSTSTTEYTADCDTNGNITALYADGKLVSEIDYVMISDPSTFAWIQSWNQVY